MIENQKITLDYYPARLSDKGDTWYVSFYAYCPAKKGLKRKRVKVNRGGNAKQRRELARRMIIEINNKLSSGWSPWVNQDGGCGMHRLADALDAWDKYASRDFEPTTTRHYTRAAADIRNWMIGVKQKPDMLAFELDAAAASAFMQHIDRRSSYAPTSYNNLLTIYRIIARWMIERRYLSINPFDAIVKRKQREKNRQPMPAEIRAELVAYLITENPRFLCVMMLIYYCFLRPKEIALLKGEHFDLQAKTLRLEGSIAKNDKTSLRTLPPALCSLLVQIMPEDRGLYLFGYESGYQFSASQTPAKSYAFSGYWAKMREKFGFDMCYKLYSLKDTGIIELLKAGVSPEDVRAQADHHSLAMTTVYSMHARPGSIGAIIDNSPKL